MSYVLGYFFSFFFLILDFGEAAGASSVLFLSYSIFILFYFVLFYFCPVLFLSL